MKPRPTFLFGKAYHWATNGQGRLCLYRCILFPSDKCVICRGRPG